MSSLKAEERPPQTARGGVAEEAAERDPTLSRDQKNNIKSEWQWKVKIGTALSPINREILTNVVMFLNCRAPALFYVLY